jgi:hypothetical protein
LNLLLGKGGISVSFAVSISPKPFSYRSQWQSFVSRKWKGLRFSLHIVVQEGVMLEEEKKAEVHRFGRRKIALVALTLLIFDSLEVYAHTYVQRHSLPVVTEEEVHGFSNWREYTDARARFGFGIRTQF